MKSDRHGDLSVLIEAGLKDGIEGDERINKKYGKKIVISSVGILNIWIFNIDLIAMFQIET